MTNADGQFIQRITAGEDIHKVYKEVYGADYSKASELLKQPDIKDSIVELLKRDGITERKLNKRLVEKLNSKKVIYYDPKLRRDEVDDNDAQIKAITVGYKLLGKLKDRDTIIDNRQITFSGDIELLKAVVQEMKEVNARLATDITGEVV